MLKRQPSRLQTLSLLASFFSVQDPLNSPRLLLSRDAKVFTLLPWNSRLKGRKSFPRPRKAKRQSGQGSEPFPAHPSPNDLVVVVRMAGHGMVQYMHLQYITYITTGLGSVDIESRTPPIKNEHPIPPFACRIGSEPSLDDLHITAQSLSRSLFSSSSFSLGVGW